MLLTRKQVPCLQANLRKSFIKANIGYIYVSGEANKLHFGGIAESTV